MSSQQGGTLRLIQSCSDAQRPSMPATAFIDDDGTSP